jgi:hypothetical protein
MSGTYIQYDKYNDRTYRDMKHLEKVIVINRKNFAIFMFLFTTKIFIYMFFSYSNIVVF